MKKRWISLLVENEVGVLARIAGLFSGKAYNLESLTVGITEDKSISRMTISLSSDDQTFEQIKKQLNRSVEVIKVIDFTNMPIHMKELMFIKVIECTDKEMNDLDRIASVFNVKIIDCDATTVLIEWVQNEDKNIALIRLLSTMFLKRIVIVRGGGVAIDAISISDKS